MNSQDIVLQWANDSLEALGYTLKKPPAIVLQTPWSSVFRLITSNCDIYLKQTPPSIPSESKIIRVLTQYHASVAEVVAVNDDYHCFLMKDAGKTLREYLKNDFQPEVLCDAARQFSVMQRSTEAYFEIFFSLGVPDWRLNQLPRQYEYLTNQWALLKSEGMTEQEIQVLHDLQPHFSAQCEMLMQYQIPETLVQSDFNTNNVLIDLNTQKLTFIDLGEIAITHPFFSLHNFLFQVIKHHNVKEQDQIYHQIKATYFENWLDLLTNQQLEEVYILSKKLWLIYGVLAYHRLMTCVDLQALKAFYADRPSRIAEGFREYIKCSY